jgi:competence protein ComEC
MPLLWLSVAFLLGIILVNSPVLADSLGSLSSMTWVGLAAACSAAAFLELRAARHVAFLRTVRLRTRLPLCALLMTFCLGAARMAAARPVFSERDIAFYNDGGPAVVTGMLASPPQSNENGQTLLLEASSLQREGGPARPVRGKVLVFTPSDSAYSYGDVLELTGQPVTPSASPTGFSYREYLARQDVYSSMPYAAARRTGHTTGSWLLGGIYTLRARAYATVNQLFPQPEAGLLSGILLGIDQDLSPELYGAFRDTGTAHIIAISGFNIAILVTVFSFLYARFVRKLWLPAWVIPTIALYAVLAGASASVLRAAIMGSIGVIGQTIGRKQASANTLAFTAALMTLQHPSVLWDPGFQLSFAATLGLVLYATPLQDGLARLLERRLSKAAARQAAGLVGEYLLLTLAAQAVTLPIMLYYFQRLSFSALLANPLALPPQPLVMIVGGLAVVLGMVLPPLGRLVSFAAWPLLAYTIRVVELLAGWKAGAVSTGSFGIPAIVLYYAVLGWLTLRPHRAAAASSPAHQAPAQPAHSIWEQLQAVLAAPVTLVIALALAVFAWRAALAAPFGRLTVYALGGEQRPVLLVRPPNGAAVLIGDGEGDPLLASAVARRLPPLQNHIDLLVIPGTVSDSSDLLSRLPPVQVLWNPAGQADTAVRRARATFEGLDAGLQELQAGDAYVLDSRTDLGDGAALRVVAAGPGAAALELEWHDFRLLAPGSVPLDQLPGDTVAAAEVIALGSADLASDPERWNLPGAALVICTGGAPPGLDCTSLARHDWVSITTDGQQMWVEEGR